MWVPAKSQTWSTSKAKNNEEMEKEGVNQREDILYCFDRSWREQQKKLGNFGILFRVFNLNQEWLIKILSGEEWDS